MEFSLVKIKNGITSDSLILKNNLTKQSITTWLLEKNLLTNEEELISFIEITPWIRSGGETYNTVFKYTTNRQDNMVCVKAIVSLNAEKRLADWKRRRHILETNNVPVSHWYWDGEATIYEPFYPYTYERINDIGKLKEIAHILDFLGFSTLKFLEDIRCDDVGNPFYVDFGFDLGEPSINQKNEASNYLFKKLPTLKKNLFNFR